MSTTPGQPCSYLPSQTASLDYRIHLTIAAADYAALLERGWRRHGMHFFRPACPVCTACRPLRVDVANFRPTRSQRRCLNRNADVEWLVREPTLTEEHVRLYNAWHADMHVRSGWPFRRATAEEYFQSFLIGRWDFAREICYFRGGRLAGVGLVDALPRALSSVYFYHDPAWRPLGPGTFTVLKEIEYARQSGRDYVYLGYWIEQCPSMSYKNRFGPHEILAGRSAETDSPRWLTAEDSPAG
ncbi:MAG: arginyltransferase [Planctomycetes bacterium]|nr:arginyltransferase [Planctomycetota bacterium]